MNEINVPVRSQDHRSSNPFEVKEIYHQDCPGQDPKCVFLPENFWEVYVVPGSARGIMLV